MRKPFSSKPLWTLLLLAGTVAGANAAREAAGSPLSVRPLTERDLPAVLAGLASQQVTRRVGDGCWVRFYDEANFRGRSVTVVGPVDLARLDVRGSKWGDWDSAVVGPQATVTAFNKQGYRDPGLAIGPGRQVPDLQRGREGPLAQLRSATVDCVA